MLFQKCIIPNMIKAQSYEMPSFKEADAIVFEKSTLVKHYFILNCFLLIFFIVLQGMQAISFHQDQTCVPCTGSKESSPIDSQRKLKYSSYLHRFNSKWKMCFLYHYRFNLACLLIHLKFQR